MQVNTCEGAYFDFTEESMMRLARAGAQIGAELIVLDDGWFGSRDNDKCSLGDWHITNQRKLPHGLKGLSDRVHELGCMCGVWFEPEMISQDSELFRAHPDYALQVPNHAMTTGRDQNVLDLTRQDVRDYVVKTVCEVIAAANIDYIKWDMNRNLAEFYFTRLTADRQQEVTFCYVLGLYDIVRRITSAFPEILFENCTGGSKRCDLGMTCFMPYTWISDNTDAVERQRIQYGCSYLFPACACDCNISCVPNHQIAWQFISQDGNTVIAMYFRELVRAHEKLHRLTLRGLEPGARYQICEYLYPLSEKNKISQSQNLLDYKGCEYSATQLMHVGRYLNKLDMDFTAHCLVLKRQAWPARPGLAGHWPGPSRALGPGPRAV